MNESTTNNQPPIFRFLVKHKWRIILPLIFVGFYFALPRYFADITAVQQNLFIKSSTLNKSVLDKKVAAIKDEVLSDVFLESLISEFNLLEKINGSKTDYLRKRMDIWIRGENYKNETAVQIWINFKEKDNPNITAVADKIAARFENNPELQVNKYVTEPYYPVVAPNAQMLADFFIQGLLLISIPLIFLWEIPNMFYSPKTKRMIFEPLKADWQEELTDAKLRGETWKVLQINIRYSFAFLASMIQKSPIGDLFEFFSKVAR